MPILAPEQPRQHGVVSREQLLVAGVTLTHIRRALRRRDLTVALPGVYVDHTGPAQ